FIGIDRPAGAAVSVDGMVYLLPTENEWYKAAYYDPTRGGADLYWLYPTRSDVTPGKSLSDTTGNNANYGGAAGSVPYITEVGQFHLSSSYYGTFDQGGNVTEWTETPGGTGYVFRGGSWLVSFDELKAENRNFYAPTTENDSLGFRVIAISAASIPEPSAALLLLFGAVAALLKRRR
ncbi:MAG: SUMF1/EgtB/PvdO family nonheme iron enzyme, partial [Patescibacteria group bacterium]|nr:SUMF1/EgtB/PvdO family nonheme iron enzyme [Patescibacteria group bacterium]